jgi:AcrR family transcriptional regulator
LGSLATDAGGRSVPSVNTLRPTRSRREEHKSQTTQALREAALKLFATQGYDSTTTDEIAETAGVAARTFFRYFPTKESVLYLRRREWFESFTGDFLSQPRTMSDVEAMCSSFVMAAPGIAGLRRYLVLYGKAVASSPTLRGRQQDHQKEHAANVAQAVATRHGLTRPDERCNLLAEVGLLTHRRVLDQWLAGPASADLANLIVDEFKVLGDLFAAR